MLLLTFLLPSVFFISVSQSISVLCIAFCLHTDTGHRGLCEPWLTLMRVSENHMPANQMAFCDWKLPVVTDPWLLLDVMVMKFYVKKHHCLQQRKTVYSMQLKPISRTTLFAHPTHVITVVPLCCLITQAAVTWHKYTPCIWGAGKNVQVVSENARFFVTRV